jgi:hypothetical protein
LLYPTLRGGGVIHRIKERVALQLLRIQRTAFRLSRIRRFVSVELHAGIDQADHRIPGARNGQNVPPERNVELVVRVGFALGRIEGVPLAGVCQSGRRAADNASAHEQYDEKGANRATAIDSPAGGRDPAHVERPSFASAALRAHIRHPLFGLIHESRDIRADFVYVTELLVNCLFFDFIEIITRKVLLTLSI